METKLKVNEGAITDILELASELIGIRTLFIGILGDTFSVMRVFSKENGSDIKEGFTIPVEMSVCNLVTCDEPLVISDTTKDERTANLEVISNTRIRAYLGTPIVLEDGSLFGTLCAVDPNPYTFNQNEIKTMKRLANILSTIIYQGQMTVVPEIEEKILQLDKLALVGQLAAGLAHEIRNPMQSVRGFIQLLFHENEKTAEFQRIVLDEVDRMNQLINDFLLITQPSAPRKEQTSVVKVIQNTVDFLKSEASLYNIEIILDEQGDIPPIAIDPSQMRQVFMNLIKNAIEAIEKNGNIDIIIKNSGEWIEIGIKDNGAGIPLTIINKVGDPFFSTKDNDGIGLGLSICKTIVREHQGKLNIESNMDGTFVTVKLPVAKQM